MNFYWVQVYFTSYFWFSDPDQGPETGRGDHLVAAHAADVGQGPEAAEIVVMTAKGGEVQRRANLVVNPDPKVKAGLNPIAGLEVGHLLRMSTMVEKIGHPQDQGHGVEAGQRVLRQIDDFIWNSCECYNLRSAEMKCEIFYVLNTNSTKMCRLLFLLLCKYISFRTITVLLYLNRATCQWFYKCAFPMKVNGNI